MYILMVEFSKDLNIVDSTRDRFCVVTSRSYSLLNNTAKALWNIMQLYNEQFNRIKNIDDIESESLFKMFESESPLRTLRIKYYSLISDILLITKELEPNTEMEADKLICRLLDISELITIPDMSKFDWENVFRIYKTVV